MSFELLSSFFLLLAALMAAVVYGLFATYLQGRDRTVAMASFAVWLGYVSVLSQRGVIAGKHPPGLAFLLIPVVLFLALFLVRQPAVGEFAGRIPVKLLVGLQSFRVVVELALLQLYLHHLVPRLMTFEGGNLDILVGLSAPLVAWLYAAGRLGEGALRAWSWFGIALLSNIVLRAALTSAGTLHTDIPNLALGQFPFTFLPGFLAPLALYLHVLLLRSLPRKTVTAD